MSKQFSILLVVLTIISGLIGGAISGRIFAVKPAMAVETKQNKVLTVEGLRIVDESGKLLINLGKYDKSYGLYFFDKNGRMMSEIDISEVSGSSVTVLNKDGKIGITMRVDEYGGLISTFGKDDASVATMGVDGNGGRINAFDKDGKLGAEMGVAGIGGHISVFGKDSKSEATMGISEFGGTIGLSSKFGRYRSTDTSTMFR